MASTVCGTFVSHKVNKVRWKPDSNNTSIVTGSSDDEENRLTVWKYYKTENEDSFAKWKSLCSIIHYGDVTEIKFIEDDVFCASSSFGGVGLFRISEHSGKAVITRLTYWDSVHFHGCREPASGNDIACFDNDIISVGDDGRIVQISIKEETPVRVIDNADSCVIRCVSVNKLNEVLTGNSRGQMKLWDLRSYSNFPQTNFTLSGSGQVGFTRVICHPTQTHIKLAGGEDGALTIWDLRNNKLAVNSISAHAQSVNELMFHPDRPEHLYSCSSNGQLWHWDSSQMTRSYPSQFPLSESNNVSYEFEETSCPWISKNLKNRITVYSIIQNLHLPINSLDVCSNYVVCGCDNEAVYLITNFCN